MHRDRGGLSGLAGREARDLWGDGFNHRDRRELKKQKEGLIATKEHKRSQRTQRKGGEDICPQKTQNYAETRRRFVRNMAET
jgi:hypothetical protein